MRKRPDRRIDWPDSSSRMNRSSVGRGRACRFARNRRRSSSGTRSQNKSRPARMRARTCRSSVGRRLGGRRGRHTRRSRWRCSRSRLRYRLAPVGTNYRSPRSSCCRYWYRYIYRRIRSYLQGTRTERSCRPDRRDKRGRTFRNARGSWTRRCSPRHRKSPAQLRRSKRTDPFGRTDPDRKRGHNSRNGRGSSPGSDSHQHRNSSRRCSGTGTCRRCTTRLQRRPSDSPRSVRGSSTRRCNPHLGSTYRSRWGNRTCRPGTPRLLCTRSRTRRSAAGPAANRRTHHYRRPVALAGTGTSPLHTTGRRDTGCHRRRSGRGRRSRPRGRRTRDNRRLCRRNRCRDRHHKSHGPLEADRHTLRTFHQQGRGRPSYRTPDSPRHFGKAGYRCRSFHSSSRTGAMRSPRSSSSVRPGLSRPARALPGGCRCCSSSTAKRTTRAPSRATTLD